MLKDFWFKKFAIKKEERKIKLKLIKNIISNI